jgi:hypothetical protein
VLDRCLRVTFASPLLFKVVNLSEIVESRVNDIKLRPHSADLIISVCLHRQVCLGLRDIKQKTGSITDIICQVYFD